MTSLSRAMMRWFMASWRRIKFLCSLPGGLLPSAIETELLPALRCGGYCLLVRPYQPPMPADKRMVAVIAEGRALIRFWLTVTKLGLAMQPSYSLIVFGHYGHHTEHLPPEDVALAAPCRSLARAAETVWQVDPDRVVFMGRIGIPPAQRLKSRSLRRPLGALVRHQLPEPSGSRGA